MRQTPVVRGRAPSPVGTQSSHIYSATWSAVSTWSDVWAWTYLRPCSSVCGSPEWTSSCCRRSSQPSSCSRTVSGDFTGDFGLVREDSASSRIVGHGGDVAAPQESNKNSSAWGLGPEGHAGAHLRGLHPPDPANLLQHQLPHPGRRIRLD